MVAAKEAPESAETVHRAHIVTQIWTPAKSVKKTVELGKNVSDAEYLPLVRAKGLANRAPLGSTETGVLEYVRGAPAENVALVVPKKVQEFVKVVQVDHLKLREKTEAGIVHASHSRLTVAVDMN
jgi:hypothetical protein